MEDTHSIQEMPRQFKSQKTIEEEININRRTITEITNIVGDSDNKVRKFLLMCVHKNKKTKVTYHLQVEQKFISIWTFLRLLGSWISK